MQLRIFLTGATGYIGGAIADALLAAGHQVTGLARSQEAASKLRAKGIQPFEGDLKSPSALAQPVSASDGVIHAGTTNDGGMDREAIRIVLDALRGAGKPLIYTSGVWVLGDTRGNIADETWPVSPAALVSWRPGVEQFVLNSEAIVIRPGVVYGRGGGIPADFARDARDGGAPRYVGTGENHWPMIHVDDLARLYLLALANPSGALYHATDGSAFRVREIAAAANGRAVSWPLDEARRTLGAYADALVLDQLVCSEKARAALGWQPREASVIDDLRSGSYAR